jgi:hypothetical protein
MTIIEESNTRFTIDNNGWKRMNAGRHASHLIREAISNCFDVPDVTEVNINVAPGYASIEDNSHIGCVDPKLIHTVFMTNKTDDPKMRGRKGRGLAELISAAEWAEVDTVGFKTTFTEGRTIEVSPRTVGTKVTVKVSSWSDADVDEIIKYGSQVIPPTHIKFTINGVHIKSRRIRCTIENVYQKTHVVIDNIQREQHRCANVEIVNLAKGETGGWIYEMGIPVQQISAKFHVNVCQRVPLNDNRDTVDSYYLNQLFGEVLNVLLPSMSAQALKHEWVDRGLPWLKTENARKLAAKMYGDISRLAVSSEDPRKNDLAAQHGYRVINTDVLTSNLGYCLNSIFPRVESVLKNIDDAVVDTAVDPQNADPDGRVRRLIAYLGDKLLNHNVHVEFFTRPPDLSGKIKIAHYKKYITTIGFNVNELNFQDLVDPNFLSVIIHEFAHDVTPMHDTQFLEAIQDLSGKLASLMLKNGAVIKSIINTINRKQVLIHCTECYKPRYVYPQNLYQINKCLDCTKKT